MARTLIETHQEQLKYLTVDKNLRKVARESGISIVSLRKVVEGTARIPTLEMGKYRAYYNRQTYSHLRSAGMSASQASRFRGLSVSKTVDTEMKMSRIIDHLTGGVLASRRKKLEKRGLYFDYEFEYDKAYADIWEGLRTSRKSIEQWEGY